MIQGAETESGEIGKSNPDPEKNLKPDPDPGENTGSETLLVGVWHVSTYSSAINRNIEGVYDMPIIYVYISTNLSHIYFNVIDKCSCHVFSSQPARHHGMVVVLHTST